MNKRLKIVLAATGTVAIVIPVVGAIVLAVLNSTATCAKAGDCGECYNTGQKGVIVVRKGVQDCDVCKQ